MYANATNARPRFRHLLASLPLILLPLAGCTALQGLQSPSGAYVAADRATYDAVAPEYAAYVANDATLSDEQRARRDRTVQTWRLRLETAERNAEDKETRRGGDKETQ